MFLCVALAARELGTLLVCCEFGLLLLRQLDVLMSCFRILASGQEEPGIPKVLSWESLVVHREFSSAVSLPTHMIFNKCAVL